MTNYIINKTKSVTYEKKITPNSNKNHFQLNKTSLYGKLCMQIYGCKSIGFKLVFHFIILFFQKNLKKNAQLLRAAHLSQKNHFLLL